MGHGAGPRSRASASPLAPQPRQGDPAVPEGALLRRAARPPRRRAGGGDAAAAELVSPPPPPLTPYPASSSSPSPLLLLPSAPQVPRGVSLAHQPEQKDPAQVAAAGEVPSVPGQRDRVCKCPIRCWRRSPAPRGAVFQHGGTG